MAGSVPEDGFDGQLNTQRAVTANHFEMALPRFLFSTVVRDREGLAISLQ